MQGFQVPGALTQDHFQPVKPIGFSTFSHLLTFIMESPFLYIFPNARKMRKCNSPVRHRVSVNGALT